MLLFLDIETTGFDPDKTELLELSAVRHDGHKIVATFDELVRPQDPEFIIPPLIERLVGITREDVQDAPEFSNIRTKFMEDFLEPDDIIVGHNISFDTGYLQAKGFGIDHTEIDTFPLTTIILPDEESYSLEVLTQKYHLPHEDAHRALSDVLANLELWKLLEDKFLTHFSPELQHQYREILQKTEWAGKRFFLPLFEQGASSFQNQNSASEEPKAKWHHAERAEHQNFVAEITKSLEEKEHMLWETLPSATENILHLSIQAAITFAEKHATSVGIAVAPTHIDQVQSVLAIVQKEFPQISCRLVQKPSRILDEQKWDQFLEQDNFSAEETTVALKILRDQEHGKNEVPNIKQEEWQVWNRICCDAGTDVWGNLITNSKLQITNGARGAASPIVGRIEEGTSTSSQQSAISNQHERVIQNSSQIIFFPHELAQQYPGKHMIFLQAENLEYVLTKNAEITSNTKFIRDIVSPEESHLHQDILFFFDLLGAHFRKSYGENPYSINIEITSTLRYEKEWQEFQKSFAEIWKTAQQEFDSEQKIFQELSIWYTFFFQQPSDNHLLFLRLFPDDNLQCITTPIMLDAAMEQFLAEKESLILLGKNFPKNTNTTFVFPGTWPPELKEKKTVFSSTTYSQLQVILPAEITSADHTPKNASRWLKNIIRASSGNIIGHFASQKQIEAVEELLFAEQLDQTVRIISHRSGSIGKIRTFLREPGRKLLLATSAVLDKVLPLDDIQFGVFFFYKFAFDAPGNVLLDARKKRFANGFMEFILPRSMAKFEKELFRLHKIQNAPYSFFCFDPRIQDSKGYGAKYLEVIPKEVELLEVVEEEVGDFI